MRCGLNLDSDIYQFMAAGDLQESPRPYFENHWCRDLNIKQKDRVCVLSPLLQMN